MKEGVDLLRRCVRAEDLLGVLGECVDEVRHIGAGDGWCGCRALGNGGAQVGDLLFDAADIVTSIEALEEGQVLTPSAEVDASSREPELVPQLMVPVLILGFAI